MVVKLDLRVKRQTEAQEKRSGALYYVAFAMAVVFIVSSTLIISKGAWRVYQLRDENKKLESQRIAYEDNLKFMEAEFKRLEAMNKESVDKLDFILSGAPVVEFLSETAARIPDGVVVESISMSNASASLKGVAFADEEVLEFGEAIAAAKSVASISVPAIKAGKREGIDLRQFSLEVELNPLQEFFSEKVEDEARKEKKDGGAKTPDEAD